MNPIILIGGAIVLISIVLLVIGLSGKPAGQELVEERLGETEKARQSLTTYLALSDDPPDSPLVKHYLHLLDDAKEKGVLFSLHMKATMMKVSDPILFGHCVSVFYHDALEKHAAVLEEIGADLYHSPTFAVPIVNSSPVSRR